MVDVGVVVAGAVGPAEVARLGDAVELHLSGGAAGGVGGARVRTVVAHVDGARGLVDAHPERVAKAHGVDLGAGPGGAGREEVAGRDAVGAVGVHLDAQDLAAQVVGVAGRALGVVGGVARGALVDGGVAVGGEGVGVVARREVEVAGRVEVDVAADMAAQAAGGGDVEDLLLAARVQGAVGAQHEAGEPVDAVEGGEVGGRAVRGRVTGRCVEPGRVVEVDEPVGGEARVDGDALQALLVVAVDVELAGHGGVPRRVGQPERAVARGVQHRTVRQDRQGHGFAGLGHALGEGDLLELLGGHGARCAADRVRRGGGGRARRQYQGEGADQGRQ